MSKLADLLRRATRIEPPPIGFGAASRKPAPTMLLVALVAERWAQRVGEATSADAFVLSGRPNEREVAEAVAAASGRPCGLTASHADGPQLAQWKQAGVDFLVLETGAPARALLAEDLAFVLVLKDELTDVQLRTLDQMPIDALYLDEEVHALSVRRQLDLQRLSGLSRKPLMLPAPLEADDQDLLCLRDAGVALAVVDLRQRGAVEALGRLRRAIEQLPPRVRLRRSERPEPVLPTAAAAGASEEEEGEE